MNGRGVAEVVGPVAATEIHTVAPGGLLVAGMATTVLASGGVLAGAFGAAGRPRRRDWGVVGLMAVCTGFPSCVVG